jgi:hypothetical protein
LFAVLLLSFPPAAAAENASASPPPAVAASLAKAFPGAAPGAIAVADFYGLSLFEIKLGDRLATLAGDGLVAAVESPAGALPTAVAGAAARAGEGETIERAVRIETRARMTIAPLDAPGACYTLWIVKGGKQGRVQIAEDGRILQTLTWIPSGSKHHKTGTPGVPAGGPKALPPAPLETIRKAFPGAALHEVEIQERLGFVVYDVEAFARVGERNVHVTQDGVIAAVEQDLPATLLPQAVQGAAEKASGGYDSCMARKREIRAVARLAPLDAPKTAFRLLIARPAGRMRLDVDPDGNPLAPPLPMPTDN